MKSNIDIVSEKMTKLKAKEELLKQDMSLFTSFIRKSS